MAKNSFLDSFKYIWSISKWRLILLVVSVAGISFAKDYIPDFVEKTTFTIQSLYMALISFGVAIVGLLSFSLLLNFLIKVLKQNINFHPDDYNVSNGVSETLSTGKMRIPFAISGFVINPLGEELFFRMLVFGLLSQFINPLGALVINVLLYYLLVHKTRELMEFLIIAVIGVITSYIYMEYSIWHAFAANGGFVAGVYFTLGIFYYFDSKPKSNLGSK